MTKGNVNMSQLIAINAPSRQGKDVIAEFIKKEFGGKIFSFKKALYEVASSMAGIELNEFISLCTSKNKDIVSTRLPLKTKTLTEFFNKVGWRINENYPIHYASPRQYLIYVAEWILKPSLGENILAHATMRDTLTNIRDYTIVSDLGFDVEMQTMLQYYGKKQILVLQVYRNCGEFDTRKYLDKDEYKGVKFEYVDNSGDIESTFSQVRDIIKKTFKTKENINEQSTTNAV